MKNKIIGLSEVYNPSNADFGCWQLVEVVTFDNEDDAEKWLHTETYDFRERGIFYSMWHATRYLGKGSKKVLEERAISYNDYQIIVGEARDRDYELFQQMQTSDEGY